MKRFKHFMNEAANKGEAYESVIVTAWNCRQQNNRSCKGTGGVPITVGNAIADALFSYGMRGGVASRFGDASIDVTTAWAQYFEGGVVPSGTKTPKTDVVIGDKKFSVKMGVGQLMSAGKAESTATFYAAANRVKRDNGALAAKIEEQIKALAGSTKPSKKGKIEPLIKSGKDALINQAEAAHKTLMETLRAAFANDQAFATAFVHEAMSGDVKFGYNSPARAQYILSTNADGSKVSVYEIDSDAYCAAVAKSVRVQVRFKSTSEKRAGKKTGYYRYWSVVSLIMGKLDEEFANTPSNLLSENILANIWSRVTAFIGQIWNTIKGWLTASWQNIIAFLGLEPDVSFNNTVNFG